MGSVPKPLMRCNKYNISYALNLHLCVVHICALQKIRKFELCCGMRSQTDRQNFTAKTSEAEVLQKGNIKHGNANQHKE